MEITDGGEAHGNLFKGTEDEPIYLGGERGGEITSHGGSVDCRKKYRGAVQGGELYHDRKGTYTLRGRERWWCSPHPKNEKMEGRCSRTGRREAHRMVVAGGLGRGRAPKKPQKTRTWREGGFPSYKRVRGESYTAVGKKNGARGIGTFGHEILKAKHLEKRRCEGAYQFTKSGTGEGLSSCLSILSSLLL